MKNRRFLGLLLLIALITLGGVYGITLAMSSSNTQVKTESIGVKTVGNVIAANGTIHSVNEATLNFSTGGKLVYLPVKEGDSVTQGQTIAQLDTYPLQQQLTAALNNYKSTRDTFDQSQANANTGVLQGSQKSALNIYNQNNVAGGGDAENNAINDAVARIIDQNQANLNNAVVNVQLANYALQLATLQAPFDGVVTHEDVKSTNVNVTPATTFSIADPNNPVFRANVAAEDIDFVNVGAPATVTLAGDSRTYSGTVSKIYPQKITVNGADVYQVDITANSLKGVAKLSANGTVTIQSSLTQEAILVPTWTILGHNSIWVLENNQPILKNVTIGNSHGNETEIIHGLNPSDRIILNPSSVAGRQYQLL